jgi:transcriptional regulator with XRE-family HTH domain
VSIHRLIRERRQAMRMSEQALASAVGVTRGAVQQWEREDGTAPKRTLRTKVAHALGISVYDLTAAESETTHLGVAQSLSLSPFDTPSLIEWEVVVMLGDKLPATFRCKVPDDANAPEHPKGLELVWSTTKAPQIGSLVIVRDAHGQTHVRQYRQGKTPGQWVAAASSAAFATFDSQADGLTVLAVAQWRPMP